LDLKDISASFPQSAQSCKPDDGFIALMKMDLIAVRMAAETSRLACARFRPFRSTTRSGG
jgi:hypothetical protein